MALDYTIKAGVTSKLLSLTLREADGTASDLTNAATTTLRVWYADGDVAEFEMEVDADPTTGVVTYAWQNGETDKIGVHRCEVVIVDADDLVSKWPANGYFRIEFTESLPRDPVSAIEWSDVVGFASEMSSVAEEVQDYVLAYVNDALDPDQFGGTASPKFRMARLFLAAHIGSGARPGTDGSVVGPVIAESAGGLSRTYANVVSSAMADLEATTYGQQFQAMIRRSPARLPFIA